MSISIEPAQYGGLSRRPVFGRLDQTFPKVVSVPLLISFILNLSGILVAAPPGHSVRAFRPAAAHSIAISAHRVRPAAIEPVSPQVTLSEFGKCYATTDPMVREVARGAGVVQVGEALPDGKLRVSAWAVPGRVPEALSDVRLLLQNSRPLLQAFCTVCLPECPATATLSDRATFAATHAWRAPGAGVLAQAYGPFLGAGAGPAAATMREVRSEGAAVAPLRLEASERLTADLLRCTPQSGVPPGAGMQARSSSLLRSLAPRDPWRSFPPASPEQSLTPAGPAVPIDRSGNICKSQRAGWSS